MISKCIPRNSVQDPPSQRVSKRNSKFKTKNKNENEKKTPPTHRSLEALPKPKEERKKKIQVTKHLQLQPKDFQFSPKKKIPKLKSKSNRK